MNRMFASYGRTSRAALLALTVAASGAAVGGTPSTLHAAQDDPTPVRVTSADVAASNEKAAMAYGALVNMWTKEFESAGRRFVAPRLARYRGTPISTRCGVIAPSNAAYCLAANTIYFDDVFLAGQAKMAGQALNTDGDMVAVGIIAHEMGHAVAMQYGFRSHNSYDNEAVADCFAGAFAHQAERDGSIEHGDLEEAFFGMAAAGDPVLEPTGNELRDARIAARVASRAHGTREQRMANFRGGLEGGSQACFASMQVASR